MISIIVSVIFRLSWKLEIMDLKYSSNHILSIYNGSVVFENQQAEFKWTLSLPHTKSPMFITIHLLS